jgi:hypothetical protein
LLFATLLMFHAPLWADDEVPSLEFLEFLAEGAVVDGQWTDPVEVGTLNVAQQGKTGDEVKGHE